MPGIPRVPGLSDALQMVQTQSELLAELPAIIAELQRAVKGLGETVAASREAIASTRRVSARLESVLDEIEEPVRKLRPGIERLATALNNPAIDRIPGIVEAIEQTVVPVNDKLQRLRTRGANVAKRRQALANRARDIRTRREAP